MSHILLESEVALKSYLARFDAKGFHIIALDIEAESNLHAYGEKICLLQIFDGDNRIIVDPLKLNTSTLRIVFENPKILKIMYDAGSDLSLLKNSVGIEVKSVLDIRPAIDLLNFEKRDLHSVLAAELEVYLENKRKYQKYNWALRPLSDLAIEYALNDVIYLFALKDKLIAKLQARNLIEEFLLCNLQIQHKDYTRDPEERYRKISGFRRLPAAEKEKFRMIFDIREKYAKAHDVPPNDVIKKGDILGIINNGGLLGSMRFSKRLRRDYINEMLRELSQALEA